MEHLKPAGNGGRPPGEILRGSDSRAACEKAPPRPLSSPLFSLSPPSFVLPSYHAKELDSKRIRPYNHIRMNIETA